MASLYTFTDNGIQFLGFQDLRTALKNDWNETFGVELDYSTTSPDGHHIDLEAKTINSVSELVKVVCSNLNRNTAKGQYLDYLAFLVGLTRLEGESDSSLKSRMDESNNDGMATLDGMTTYLRNSISTGVSVAENANSDAVDGIGPNGIRVSVPANYEYNGNAIGTDACNNYIASMIWKCKPAGIKSYGNRTGVAKDTLENSHNVNFSVPVSLPISLKIELSLYTEETFPNDGIELVKSSICEWALSNFHPGTDVIPQRLFVPIFLVNGIAGATIQLKKKSGSEWSTDTIRISSEEIATISSSDIEVKVN